MLAADVGAVVVVVGAVAAASLMLGAPVPH